METIRNPIEWVSDQVRGGAAHAAAAGHSVRATPLAAPPRIRRIALDDLRLALRRGTRDFGAARTDVLFIVVLYPLAGLLLAWVTFGHELVHLLFPLASGFALLGPAAAVGLYEMSRLREHGQAVSWASAFGVLSAPSAGPIFVLALGLCLLFAVWVGAAHLIYALTLGPDAPGTLVAFAGEALTTGAGWAMILIGLAVGFLFALAAFALSVFSFPLMVDRHVGLAQAVGVSLRAVRANPVPMAAWGLVVAAGLVLGSLPLFLGLILVLPILGHATWHLYRLTVDTSGD
jgi:uncharacterized membrane protein